MEKRSGVSFKGGPSIMDDKIAALGEMVHRRLQGNDTGPKTMGFGHDGKADEAQRSFRSFHKKHGSGRGIMPILHARCLGCFPFFDKPWVQGHAAHGHLDHFPCNSAGPQDHRILARRVNDGRFDTDVAGTAIKDAGNDTVHIKEHILSGRRTRFS